MTNPQPVTTPSNASQGLAAKFQRLIAIVLASTARGPHGVVYEQARHEQLMKLTSEEKPDLPEADGMGLSKDI